MQGKGFENLNVWRMAKDLAVKVYQITDKGKISKDYALKDQVRRAAVSVVSNIAEGDERGTNKESARFFYMSKGSIAEILTQFIIAKEIEYFSEEEVKEVCSEYKKLAKMVGALIVYRLKESK